MLKMPLKDDMKKRSFVVLRNGVKLDIKIRVPR